MNDLQTDISVIRQFINVFRGIGKTRSIDESIRLFIDEILLHKKEFKVLYIVPNREAKLNLKFNFSDYYLNYIETMSTYDILYRLSNYPHIINREYLALVIGSGYERIFIDPSCYEILLEQSLDKLNTIKETVVNLC